MNTNLHSYIIGESLLCEDIVAYFHFKWHENLICYTDGYADQHIPSINTLMSLDSAEIGMTSKWLKICTTQVLFSKDYAISFLCSKTDWHCWHQKTVLDMFYSVHHTSYA